MFHSSSLAVWRDSKINDRHSNNESLIQSFNTLSTSNGSILEVRMLSLWSSGDPRITNNTNISSNKLNWIKLNNNNLVHTNLSTRHCFDRTRWAILVQFLVSQESFEERRHPNDSFLLSMPMMQTTIQLALRILLVVLTRMLLMVRFHVVPRAEKGFENFIATFQEELYRWHNKEYCHKKRRTKTSHRYLFSSSSSSSNDPLLPLLVVVAAARMPIRIRIWCPFLRQSSRWNDFDSTDT